MSGRRGRCRLAVVTRTTCIAGLLLLASACQKTEEALVVVLTVDSRLAATCYRVEVRDALGGQGHALMPRVDEQQEYRVGVRRGELPEEVAFEATALYGPNGCEAPLMANGVSARVPGRFSGDAVGRVDLTLEWAAEWDGDRDFFLAPDAGGSDCNDGDPEVYPGAPEDCRGGVDLNCDGRYGCDDPTCAPDACAGAPVAVSFTTPAQSLEGSRCSERVHLELVDAAGRTARSPRHLSLALSVSAGLNVGFFEDEDCSARLEATGIDSDAAFYFRGKGPAVGELLAEAAGLPTASQPVTFSEPRPASVAFTTGPKSVLVGVCSSAVRLALLDAAGEPVKAPEDLTVALGVGDGGALYGEGTCAGTGVTALHIAADAGSADFYFSSPRAGPLEVSADGGVLGVASQTHVIVPDVPVDLRFATPPRVAEANACSSRVVVEAVDRLGNASPLVADTRLALTSPPDSGLTLWTDLACSAPADGGLVIAQGASSASFHFQGAREGAFDLGVSAEGDALTPASQRATVVLPWLTGAVSRHRLTVNVGSSPPPGGYEHYTVVADFDPGQGAGDCADAARLHVHWWNGTQWNELDREVTPTSTAAVQVRFMLQADIAADGSDGDYAITCVSGGQPPPKSDLDGVYLFHDDFENGLGKWTANGAWAIGTEWAHGGTSALRFPVEGQGTHFVIAANPPLDEADVMVEAWLRTNNNLDFSVFARQSPSPLAEYEANVVNADWKVGRMQGGNWSQHGGQASSGVPPNTWYKVGLAVKGDGVRIFINGAQKVPTNNAQTMNSSRASGNIGFRKWRVTGAPVDVDDVTVRAYTFPEPTVTVGPAETPGP